jgi:hypothetical protein
MPDSAAARGRLALSDPLLFDYSPPVEARLSLADVLPKMRASTMVRAATRSGVFWELHGIRHGDSVTYELRLEPVDRPGLLSRVFNRILPGTRSSERSLRWSTVPRAGVDEHGIDVDFGKLSPGHYRLSITAAVTGEPVAVRSTRLIEIVSR